MLSEAAGAPSSIGAAKCEMNTSLVMNLTALATLLPAAILAPFRKPGERGRVFWVLVAVAVAGPLVLSFLMNVGAWRTGFGATLWVSIAATMVVFAALAVVTAGARRLAPLLLPYLVLLGALATIWTSAPERPLTGLAPAAWLQAHIAVSVLTYALLTLAAVAGLAVLLQERAVRTRQPTALSRLLPSVADGESLQVRLLGGSELVLGLGLLTGMATQYLVSGTPLEFDHKTLFSLTTFAVIGLLLLAHLRTGVRGRRAARLVLLAYLLLTLAFPGVKFVTDVLLA